MGSKIIYAVVKNIVNGLFTIRVENSDDKILKRDNSIMSILPDEVIVNNVKYLREKLTDQYLAKVFQGRKIMLVEDYSPTNRQSKLQLYKLPLGKGSAILVSNRNEYELLNSQ